MVRPGDHATELLASDWLSPVYKSARTGDVTRRLLPVLEEKRKIALVPIPSLSDSLPFSSFAEPRSTAVAVASPSAPPLRIPVWVSGSVTENSEVLLAV